MAKSSKQASNHRHTPRRAQALMRSSAADRWRIRIARRWRHIPRRTKALMRSSAADRRRIRIARRRRHIPRRTKALMRSSTVDRAADRRRIGIARRRRHIPRRTKALMRSSAADRRRIRIARRRRHIPPPDKSPDVGERDRPATRTGEGDSVRIHPARGETVERYTASRPRTKVPTKVHRISLYHCTPHIYISSSIIFCQGVVMLNLCRDKKIKNKGVNRGEIGS